MIGANTPLQAYVTVQKTLLPLFSSHSSFLVQRNTSKSDQISTFFRSLFSPGERVFKPRVNAPIHKCRVFRVCEYREK